MSQSGEQTCRSCGAPLAGDQRYCLNCGQRCGGPRVDFRRHLAGPSAPREAVPPAEPEERPQRDYAPLAAVGGIAVLGLMLLVGVLIGKGANDTAGVAPPQVIRVEGDGAGGETTSSDEDAGEKDEGSANKAKGKGSGKGLVGGGGKKSGGAVTASDAELKALQEQSPEEYSENSAKLPDEIATPGAPPPKDSKAPGGGGKGTAIE